MNKIKFGDNSFDIIRLIAAIQVVIGHGLTHLELESQIGYFNEIIRWFPGVVVMFSLSGYLVTASMDRSEQKGDFLKKRLLRIYPGLIVSFVITLIVIMFFVDLDWKDILLFSGLHTTFFQWYTPELLRSFGTGAVNGALWTIVIELQFYLFTLLFARRMKKMSMKKWLIIIGIFLIINSTFPLIENYVPNIVFGLLLQTFIPYLYIYLIGAFLYTFKDELLPILIANFKYIASALLIWVIANSFMNIQIGQHYDVVVGVLLPVAVISGGYVLGKHRLSFDISYGVYLYHMVIINVLVELSLTRSYLSFVIVLGLSVLAGVFSWYIVEKPILDIKNVKKQIPVENTTPTL